MIKVAFSSSFQKAYKRKIAADVQRKKRLLSKIEIFQANPFDPKLRTHKLSGKLSELWSFSVEYDLRIIFYFSGDDEAVFVDIGSHDEVY